MKSNSLSTDKFNNTTITKRNTKWEEEKRSKVLPLRKAEIGATKEEARLKLEREQGVTC